MVIRPEISLETRTWKNDDISVLLARGAQQNTHLEKVEGQSHVPENGWVV